MVEVTCKRVIYNRGSMLYEVEDDEGKLMVLKIVPHENEIMNEVMVLSSVESPHIIKGYAHGYCIRPSVGSKVQFCHKKRGAVPFLLVERGEMSLVNVDSSISPLTILEQAASGLMALHDAHFIHCDIKDANMLLMSDGRVAICDFGISCHVNDACRIERQLCTQGFKPPEALMRNPSYYTTAIDIWSLGMVIHTRLFGPPFGSYQCAMRRDESAVFNDMIEWYQNGRQILHDHGAIGHLIYSMMEWSPYERPTAAQVYENVQTIRQNESMSSDT